MRGKKFKRNFEDIREFEGFCDVALSGILGLGTPHFNYQIEGKWVFEEAIWKLDRPNVAHILWPPSGCPWGDEWWLKFFKFLYRPYCYKVLDSGEFVYQGRHYIYECPIKREKNENPTNKSTNANLVCT